MTCDAGTTGSKCTLFDTKGRALYSVRGSYRTDYPKPNWSEQHPDMMLKAVQEGIRELLMQVNPSRIACVGLSGTMNGCIPVDASGKVLYPNIIHSDARAEAQVDRIGEVISFDDFYQLTGNRLNNHYTLPKILWFRDNMPQVYRRARWWLNTKDYIYGCLTGRFGVTDYSDASLTIALDIKRKRWADGLLKELGVDLATMPQILQGNDVTGRVSREAAQATGLLAGTPVAVGGGDGACSGRGAGLYQPGSAYCYIGSSAWVSQLTEQPLLDPKARVFNYLDMDGEANYVCGTVQCGSAAYNWALGNLLGVSGSPSGADFYRIESMARQIAPGSEGVMFLPTLMGERTPYWDANTRGCLMGFTLYHDQRHIARAVYEGIAFALDSSLEVMRECDAPVHSMMLTGGGAQSGLWPDMLASVFEVNAQVHATPGESTSMGAAIAAGVGVGIFGSYAEGASVVGTRSTHLINPEWAREYRRIYPIYARMYERLKPLYDEIAQL